jgi:hypothetical protein
VKSSVRPGSASVCLVVESGGRRCCSATGVAAVARPAPPCWPDGDGDGVAAGGCCEVGELASSAGAPLTQHTTRSVAARRMGCVAVKRKAMPFAPCARRSRGFCCDSATMRSWCTTRRNLPKITIPTASREKAVSTSNGCPRRPLGANGRFRRRTGQVSFEYF